MQLPIDSKKMIRSIVLYYGDLKVNNMQVYRDILKDNVLGCSFSEDHEDSTGVYIKMENAVIDELLYLIARYNISVLSLSLKRLDIYMERSITGMFGVTSELSDL